MLLLHVADPVDRLQQLLLVAPHEPRLAQLLVFVDEPTRLEDVRGGVFEALVELHVDDEVVHVLLGARQLELTREDSDDERRAARAEDAGEDGDAAAAVRVGHDVTVADGQERDGNEPHGVEEVGVVLVMVHLAGAQHPGRDDEDGQHEYGEHVLRVQRHHRLENELEVEVDTVECAEALRRRVGEEPAVQHQHSAQQVHPAETKRSTVNVGASS